MYRDNNRFRLHQAFSLAGQRSTHQATEATK